MQRHKALFSDPEHHGTISNVQTCLRLNDLDEIDDATHHLTFHMLGLFSFRQMAVEDAIHLWLDFLDGIGLTPDYVTIHPDRLDAWTPLYRGRVPVRSDDECRWSDGLISGYCTEFYRDGVEIGNIVNPLGNCIDCGFGLERLVSLIEGGSAPKKTEVLKTAILTVIESGYRPGPKEQGYVLRKLLRLLRSLGGELDHPFMEGEIARHERSQQRYERLLPRNRDKPPEWWWDTHGIDTGEMV